MLFLTPEELETLTGYTRKAHQRRALQAMGIKFLVNPNGTPVVPRQAILGQTSTGECCMPDLLALEAINGKKA